uniref:CD302 molecule n=1 Tax=Leptobrachium leishanense TaxID=445787 RepID=A0A8C5PVR3_9ANUR
ERTFAHLFKNNCYSFVHATSGSLLGVGLARELCKGSDILSINTEEENNFLLTMFQTKWNGPNEILLGMFYDSDDDALKWFDTSELTYKNFREGAQVEMGLLTCAKMNTSTGRWDLVNCETFAQAGTLCKTKASTRLHITLVTFQTRYNLNGFCLSTKHAGLCHLLNASTTAHIKER